MSDELRIRVPWVPPPSLGQNAHRHWRGKHPDEQVAKDAGYKAAKSTIARKRWECPDMPVAVVVIHWERKSRRKDWDNASGVIKHLQDGICMALNIDDKRFITGMTFQRMDPKKQGYVEYIIRPATDEERRIAS